MLPAISADLPVYLTPPSDKEAGRQTTTDAGFGPSTKVELSTDKAVAAQSSQPDNGLYGADGQFVETLAGRADAAPQTSHDAQKPAFTDASAPARAQSTESSRGLLSGSDVPGASGSRDLSIDSFSSAVPPAAREELRSLADRVGRKTSEQDLSSSDYRQVAELMERVGRHHEAKRAADAARALDEPTDDADEVVLVAEAKAEQKSADAAGRDTERVEAPTPAEAADVE